MCQVIVIRVSLTSTRVFPVLLETSTPCSYLLVVSLPHHESNIGTDFNTDTEVPSFSLVLCRQWGHVPVVVKIRLNILGVPQKIFYPKFNEVPPFSRIVRSKMRFIETL